MEFVSFAWVFNALMCIAGAKLAATYGKKLSDVQVLVVPVVLMSISMLIMGFNPNIVTVWLYGAMGITQGWTAATLAPMVQKHAKPSEQTSVLSITKTLAELFYIPVVWAVGYTADIKLEYGLFTTVVVFLPLSLIVIQKLRKKCVICIPRSSTGVFFMLE